jgi:hypothetical protein
MFQLLHNRAFIASACLFCLAFADVSLQNASLLKPCASISTVDEILSMAEEQLITVLAFTDAGSSLAELVCNDLAKNESNFDVAFAIIDSNEMASKFKTPFPSAVVLESHNVSIDTMKLGTSKGSRPVISVGTTDDSGDNKELLLEVLSNSRRLMRNQERVEMKKFFDAEKAEAENTAQEAEANKGDSDGDGACSSGSTATTHQYQYCIVGAGPGGVQLAHLMLQKQRDFVLLEREATAGSFFRRYPVERKLISINKRFTGRTDPEFNLRHDW